MSLPKFGYLAPGTIGEACTLLSRYKGRAKVIAGGTDLLVKMKDRELTPQYLVGIRNIAELDYIDYDGMNGLRLGAMTSNQSLATSLIIRQKFGILATAAAEIGTPQIRHLGTVGGNLCNAAPSADTASALIALGAEVRLVNSTGERTIALEDFFTGPGETVLKDDELLTEIQVPNLPPRTGGIYLKLFSRSAVDIATVGVAVMLTMWRDGICYNARIVLGAVAPTPLRAKQAEEIITGRRLEDGVVEQAAQAAAREARPISDVRSSAEYRREMVRVLTRRAIMQSLEQVKSA